MKSIFINYRRLRLKQTSGNGYRKQLIQQFQKHKDVHVHHAEVHNITAFTVSLIMGFHPHSQFVRHRETNKQTNHHNHMYTHVYVNMSITHTH